jgi:hypothetical protein
MIDNSNNLKQDFFYLEFAIEIVRAIKFRVRNRPVYKCLCAFCVNIILLIIIIITEQDISAPNIFI